MILSKKSPPKAEKVSAKSGKGGKSIDSEQSERAKKYVYNLLRIRSRSEKEIIVRLKEKAFGKETIQNIIILFKGNGLIDDLKFARAWVDSRLKSNPKGEVVLRHELIEKGITKDVIDRVLTEKEGNEEETVKRLAEERMKALKNLPRLKAKKRLYDYLARRGFDYDIINSVIGHLYEK